MNQPTDLKTQVMNLVRDVLTANHSSRLTNELINGILFSLDQALVVDAPPEKPVHPIA